MQRMLRALGPVVMHSYACSYAAASVAAEWLQVLLR